MAIRIEQNSTGRPEYVVDGWENGISDSPELGIADMRNINNDSIPGIVMANYALKQVSQNPISSQAFTADASADTIAWSGTSLQKGAAITCSNGSGTCPAGITAGTTYYAKSTGTTVQLTATFSPASGGGLGGALDITDTGTPGFSFSTVNMGQMQDYTVWQAPGNNLIAYFISDHLGKIWYVKFSGNDTADCPLNFPIVLKGNTLTNGHGKGIVVMNDFLFSFRTSKIDALYIPSNTWTNGNWTLLASASPDAATPHKALWGQDGSVYYCDTNYVGNLTQAGDITALSTYSQNQKALLLPTNETASYLVEPSIDTDSGGYIYIGTTTSNFIYPWRRFLLSPSSGQTAYDAPLVMPETGTYKMLNINKIVYILAGQRGNIYYTNGSTIVLFKSLPKYPFGTPYPLVSWGGVMSLNNNLCLGVTESTSISASVGGGCWAITLAVGQLLNSVAGAIRYKGMPSIGLYNADVLIACLNGLTYFCGSYNGTNGTLDMLDNATPTFYNYPSTLNANPPGSYAETDIIPFGTAINPGNTLFVEGKLDTPLVAGEKFRVSMRSNLNASASAYTQLFEQTTAGSLTGYVDSGIPLENLQWIQLKVELQASASASVTPSFCRLRELRFS